MAKIILTQEVSGLGSAGDIVEVKDGYARHFLLPQGVAIRWTRGAEKEVVNIKAARNKRAARDLDHADEIKGKLEAAPVNVKVRAGKDGRLFGAVTVTDIAGALEATTGEAIDKRAIAVGAAIKTLGSHKVAVRLHDEVSAEVALNVVPA
jgi:large subunit ribosomal protein L9